MWRTSAYGLDGWRGAGPRRMWSGGWFGSASRWGNANSASPATWSVDGSGREPSPGLPTRSSSACCFRLRPRSWDWSSPTRQPPRPSQSKGTPSRMAGTTWNDETFFASRVRRPWGPSCPGRPGPYPTEAWIWMTSSQSPVATADSPPPCRLPGCSKRCWRTCASSWTSLARPDPKPLGHEWRPRSTKQRPSPGGWPSTWETTRPSTATTDLPFPMPSGQGTMPWLRTPSAA